MLKFATVFECNESYRLFMEEVLELFYMYYKHACSWCAKIFYTYHDSREGAARKLFEGIKRHLVEYGEDHKEYQFDEAPSIEVNQMYYAMSESTDKPYGDYEV